jgi:hypothetical protein
MSFKLDVTMLVFLGLVMQMSCTPCSHQGPVSDHFDGVRFFNPGKPMDKGFFQALTWCWTRQPQP